MKADILARLSTSPRPVDLPDGSSVLVRPWTAAERQVFQREHEVAGSHKLMERLFVASVCDEAGRLVFGRDDIDAVSGLNGAAVEAVAEVALELNSLRRGDPAADPSTASRI